MVGWVVGGGLVAKNLLNPLFGTFGRVGKAFGHCAVILKLAHVPLAVQIVQLTRNFAIDPASFELFLNPAALFAKCVCIVTGGEFMGT